MAFRRNTDVRNAKRNYNQGVCMSNEMVSERKVPVEVYSRVVGYYRPVNQWNKGKQQEYEDRHEWDPKQIVEGLVNDSR